MKKIASALLLAFLFVTMAFSTATAKENPATATTVFTVSPKMTCQNCEKKVKTNMRFEKGVKDVATNVKAGTVTIKYSVKDTDEAKLIAAFKKIGYTATVVAASDTCGNCSAEKGKAACAHSQGKTCKECPRQNTPDCCKNNKK